MRHAKLLMKSLLFFTALFPLTLSARGHIEIDTGYRYDRILYTTLFTGAPGSGLALTGLEDYKNMQSFVIGGRAEWIGDCLPLVLQVQGHYGVIASGDAIYARAAIEGDTFGNSYDFSGGVGYLLPFCHCFELIPLVGFSVDSITLDIENPVFTFLPVLQLEDITGKFHSHSSWCGPWLGFDLLFNTVCGCPLRFDVGYQYHFGWGYHDLTTLPFPALNLVSTFQKGRFDHMQGHVAYLQCLYPFCHNWHVGLRAQYTNWNNKTRQSITSFPPTSIIFGERFVKDEMVEFNWRSFTFTLVVGNSF